MEPGFQNIVIRERSQADLADLTLRVIRKHAGPLFVCLLIGILPFILLNGWLTYEYIVDWGDYDAELWPFLWITTLLTLIEAPFATCLVTLYLGHWMFVGRPRKIMLLEAFLETLPQMLFYQAFLRPFFILHVFMPEVILLERTRIRPRDGRVSTFKRNRMLHWNELGNLFGLRVICYSFGAGLIGCWLVIAFYAAPFVIGSYFPPEQWLPWLYAFLLWLMAGLFAVYRFLCYLNVRIRHEGWELDLVMKAEKLKLTGGRS
jgi:hypothetical protein